VRLLQSKTATYYTGLADLSNIATDESQGRSTASAPGLGGFWSYHANPEAEATLQRQRGFVLPNAVVTTNRLASVLGKSLATYRAC